MSNSSNSTFVRSMTYVPRIRIGILFFTIILTISSNVSQCGAVEVYPASLLENLGWNNLGWNPAPSPRFSPENIMKPLERIPFVSSSPTSEASSLFTFFTSSFKTFKTLGLGSGKPKSRSIKSKRQKGVSVFGSSSPTSDAVEPVLFRVAPDAATGGNFYDPYTFDTLDTFDQWQVSTSSNDVGNRGVRGRLSTVWRLFPKWNNKLSELDKRRKEQPLWTTQMRKRCKDSEDSDLNFRVLSVFQSVFQTSVCQIAKSTRQTLVELVSLIVAFVGLIVAWTSQDAIRIWSMRRHLGKIDRELEEGMKNSFWESTHCRREGMKNSFWEGMK